MLVLATPFGDNSNRFFQHIHIDSFCRENGVEFINPHLDIYARTFPRIECGGFTPNIFDRLMRFFPRLLDANGADDRAWILSRASRCRYVKGWGFRAYEEVVASRSYYRNIFTPTYADDLRLKIDELKRSGSVMSVHIRRGDYRRWQSGRYFYTDPQYVEIVRRALKTCENIGTILLFSNEDIEIEAFRSLGANVIVLKSAWHEEQWMMSLSDYIIGPPSTFSGWASYVGNVPLWHVADPTDSVKFTVCNG